MAAPRIEPEGMLVPVISIRVAGCRSDFILPIRCRRSTALFGPFVMRRGHGSALARQHWAWRGALAARSAELCHETVWPASKAWPQGRSRLCRSWARRTGPRCWG